LTPLISQRRGRAAVMFIFVTVALDMLAFGIIAPVLPKLIIRFEAGDIARAASITGYFALAWATMQFVFSPVLGAWSDRHGRRPVVLLSNFGLGLDYVFMALAPTLPWLFVGRLISGITSASLPTAFAYISDVTPPERRAKQFGLLGAAFGLGFIIGPAVGGLLGNVNLRLPFWFSAGLSLANAIYGFFILPESLPPESRARERKPISNPLSSLSILRSHPELLSFSVVLLLFYLAQQSLASVFVLYCDYRYSWNERTIGLSLSLVGVCSSIVSAVLVGPWVKRFGERRTLFAGLLFGFIGFASFGLAGRGWLLMAAIPFISLWGLGGPAVQSLMTRRVDATAQGQLQGAINSLRGISGMIGPLIFTQVFAAAIGPRFQARLRLPGAPYFAAAILLLVALWVGRRAGGALRPATEAAPMGEKEPTK
jgi:DHA1 family tetracycline resistance protein-like MFS transporter